MRRFFFNHFDGSPDLDLEGSELIDLGAARREAVLYTSLLMKDHPELVEGGHDLRIEVADEGGAVLFAIIVSTLETQAQLRP